MSESWPRLTETLPVKEPGRCCSCGAGEPDVILAIWQEHDQADKPEARYLLLCPKCSDQIIEPHPRLYDKIDSNAPAPGAMAICANCLARVGLRCPAAKANGGPGVVITCSQAGTAHMDGRGPKGRWSRWIKIYGAPPSACTGHIPVKAKVSRAASRGKS